MSPAEQLSEFMEFRASLLDESDRGLVLAVAAHLDVQLKLLLQRSFIEAALTDKKLHNRLYEGSGSLAGFSSRIDIAYVTGLIPTVVFRSLHCLRDMRNDFAHKHKVTSLDLQRYTDKVKNLWPLPEDLGNCTPRQAFVAAAMHHLLFLQAQILRMSHSASNTTTNEQALRETEEVTRRMFDATAQALPQMAEGQIPTEEQLAASLKLPFVRDFHRILTEKA